MSDPIDPPPGARFAALARWHSPNSDQWNQPGSHLRRYHDVASARRNIHFGGNGQIIGTVGVIGPTRMAYERVIPIVDITAKLLSSALSSH